MHWYLTRADVPHVFLCYDWKDRYIWATNQRVYDKMLLVLMEKEPFWMPLMGASIQNERHPGQQEVGRRHREWGSHNYSTIFNNMVGDRFVLSQ